MSKHVSKHARPRPRPRRRGRALAAVLPAGTAAASLAGGGTLAMAPAAYAAPAPQPVMRGIAQAPQAADTAAAHRAPAARPASYVLRPGEYLSEVARRFCGTPRDWVGLWHATRGIADPNVVYAGQVIRIACNSDGPGYSPPSPARLPLTTSAVVRHRDRFDGGHGACGDGDGDGLDAPCSVIFPQRYAARHSAPQQAPAVSYQAQAVSYQAPVTVSGGFQACVIRRESGGDAHAVNASSGAGGLYQFLPSTWAALGFSGLPENASVATQNAAFAKAYAQSGVSPWRPYDGC